MALDPIRIAPLATVRVSLKSQVQISALSSVVAGHTYERWGDGSRLDSRFGSAQLIPFEIGTYEFEVSSVSPVRILVNGTWAVDKFFSDPERITQSSKLVIAENGPKLVELEYYNQSIAPELSVNIRKISE